MSQSTIAIVGCGWLGLPLGQQLVQSAYRVTGSTTREERLPLLKETGIEGFILRSSGEGLIGDNLEGLFGVETLVLNIPPGRKRPDVAKQYPEQVRLLLDKALASGVRRVIFVSSTSVYPNTGDWVTEETAVAPSTESGRALVMAEEMVRERMGEEQIVLRMAGLVGGERKAGRFFAGKKGIAGGLSRINMVHRVDCLAVMQRLLEGEHWGATFNVCADEHPTKMAFYEQQSKKQGFAPPEFIANITPHKVVSNKAIKTALNYEFQYADPMQF